MVYALPVEDRIRIILLGSYGFNVSEISESISASRSTVYRWQKRFEQTSNLDTRYFNSGRKRCTSFDDDLEVNLMAIDKPFFCISDITNELCTASRWTISRRLSENGIRSRIAAKKTRLNNTRKSQRLYYCNSMENFNQWENTVFVDESHFCTSKLGGKRVLRPKGSRFDERFVNLIEHSTRVVCSVFGAISCKGFGPLIKINGHMNSQQYCEILEETLPYLNLHWPHGNDYYWIQDNCPVHNSNETMLWQHLNMHGQFIDHPPFSPDLNPIENIWGRIKERLKWVPKASNSDELFANIKCIWDELSHDVNYVRNLILSMPRRLQACVNNNGGITKY